MAAVARLVDAPQRALPREVREARRREPFVQQLCIGNDGQVDRSPAVDAQPSEEGRRFRLDFAAPVRQVGDHRLRRVDPEPARCDRLEQGAPAEIVPETAEAREALLAQPLLGLQLVRQDPCLDELAIDVGDPRALASDRIRPAGSSVRGPSAGARARPRTAAAGAPPRARRRAAGNTRGSCNPHRGGRGTARARRAAPRRASWRLPAASGGRAGDGARHRARSALSSARRDCGTAQRGARRRRVDSVRRGGARSAAVHQRGSYGAAPAPQVAAKRWPRSAQ